MKRSLKLFIISMLVFSHTAFFIFGKDKTIDLKKSISWTDPDILFPLEKIEVAPALSKFYLRDHLIIGSQSDLKKIVLHFMDGVKKFLSLSVMEVEDFTIKKGLIYLLAYSDQGPGIIIYNLHGDRVHQFQLAAVPPSMTSIAVDSQGVIYHNNPSLPEGLITAYYPDGQVKKIYGDHLPAQYFASMKLLNRVIMCTDSHDNLILAFRFDPIIRKYNKRGQLIFERTILTKEVLQRKQSEKQMFPKRFTLTKERRVKISAFTYFTSITVDDNDKIYLKLGPESLIFQLNPSGILEKKYLLVYGQDSIEDFDFWESSMALDGSFLYFPLTIEGSESFGYILKYKIH